MAEPSDPDKNHGGGPSPEGSQDGAGGAEASSPLIPASEDLCRRLATAGLVPHVVHRLSNAMVVMVGALELLELKEREPARRARLSAASAESRECSELLKALARYASGCWSGGAATDLVSLVEGVELLLRPVASSAQHELECMAPVQDGALVRGDKERLEHLIVLMVLEALGGPEPDRPKVQACGPGRVRVRVLKAGASVMLRVSATRGPDALCFSREATSAPGLEAAGAIAGAHGASMRVRALGERTLGMCVRFRALELPDTPSVAAQSDASAAVDPPPRRAPGRVLVAESEELLAGLLGEVLVEAGFRVETVTSAVELTKLLAQGDWTFALCDRALVDELPELESQLREALGSGLAWTAGSERAGEPALEQEPVLWKPYRPVELMELVEELSDRKG